MGGEEEEGEGGKDGEHLQKDGGEEVEEVLKTREESREDGSRKRRRRREKRCVVGVVALADEVWSHGNEGGGGGGGGRAGQGRAGQGRAGQGRAGQGREAPSAADVDSSMEERTNKELGRNEFRSAPKTRRDKKTTIQRQRTLSTPRGSRPKGRKGKRVSFSPTSP